MKNLDKLIESFGVATIFVNIVTHSTPPTEQQQIQKELMLKAYKNLSHMLFEAIVNRETRDEAGEVLREFMGLVKKEIDHARDIIKMINVNDAHLNKAYELEEAKFGDNLKPEGVVMQ